MASAPRRFEAHRPVLITVRCNLRLDLLAFEGMRELLLQKLATYAGRCRVDVLAWAIQSNHAHFIVRQDQDAHDPGRRTGIAAFVRNVMSAVAVHGHARGTFQGRFLERTYRSHTIRTTADLVRFLAYVHGQRAHHRLGPEAVDAAPSSSAGLLERGLPDGVVELMPGGPVLTGGTLEERCRQFQALIARVVEIAVADERRVAALDVPGTTLTSRQLRSMRRDAWRQAVARAAAELGVVGTDGDVRTLRWDRLADVIGRDAVASARERLMSVVWIRNEPDLRRPPQAGSVIEIRVRYERPGPALRT